MSESLGSAFATVLGWEVLWWEQRAALAVDRWRSRRLSVDRRIGMTLIAVAGLGALLGGLWFGEGWAAVAVAGWIVTTAMLAGWFFERVSRRAGQHAGRRP